MPDQQLTTAMAQMRVDGNYGSTLGYEPNSYGEWQEQPEFAEPPLNWKARPITGISAKMMMITIPSPASFSV